MTLGSASREVSEQAHSLLWPRDACAKT
jgi:hypothetical protein